jgi:VanZ family protein
MYGVLAALLTRVVQVDFGRWRAVIVGIAIASAFGAADEWHQRFIPGRSTELADWEADSLGACAGALAAVLLPRVSPIRSE